MTLIVAYVLLIIVAFGTAIWMAISSYKAEWTGGYIHAGVSFVLGIMAILGLIAAVGVA